MASMPNASKDQINAALADITTAPGSAGAIARPAFAEQIGNLIELGRPTINAISRAPLPPSGMRVEWPQWTTTPLVAVQATQKTEIASRAAVIGTAGADILTWAGGNDVSLQLAQRSSPSFLEQWVRAASEEYARVTNAYVITQLLAAAEVVAPPATPTFLNSIAALMNGFDPATAPSGSLFLAMSWDVGMVMVGVPVNSGPAFWSGSDRVRLRRPVRVGRRAQHVHRPAAPREDDAARRLHRRDVVRDRPAPPPSCGSSTSACSASTSRCGAWAPSASRSPAPPATRRSRR